MTPTPPPATPSPDWNDAEPDPLPANAALPPDSSFNSTPSAFSAEPLPDGDFLTPGQRLWRQIFRILGLISLANGAGFPLTGLVIIMLFIDSPLMWLALIPAVLVVLFLCYALYTRFIGLRLMTIGIAAVFAVGFLLVFGGMALDAVRNNLSSYGNQDELVLCLLVVLLAIGFIAALARLTALELKPLLVRAARNRAEPAQSWDTAVGTQDAAETQLARRGRGRRIALRVAVVLPFIVYGSLSELAMISELGYGNKWIVLIPGLLFFTLVIGLYMYSLVSRYWTLRFLAIGGSAGVALFSAVFWWAVTLALVAEGVKRTSSSNDTLLIAVLALLATTASIGCMAAAWRLSVLEVRSLLIRGAKPPSNSSDDDAFLDAAGWDQVKPGGSA